MARDTDGTPVVVTRDETDEENPIKPYPDLDYLRYFFRVISDTSIRQLFIDKPRQIMATWAVLTYADWELRHRQSRFWLLSKMTQDEGEQLLSDKVKHINDHLPLWVQQALPMTTRRLNHFRYPGTGGQLLAIASNAHRRTLRGNTPSAVIIDEAAYQDGFQEMVAAGKPTGCRFIAQSTANASGPGARYCQQILGKLP